MIKKTLQQISWNAIATKMKSRSVDDLRYYWNARMLPILLPQVNAWSQEDDEALLQHIVD